MECNDSRLFDTSNNATYFVIEQFYKFRYLYSNVHPFLSFILCVLGLAANVIHIMVLTRPRMRHSSVHTVLVCIAISDMGTMTSYLMYISRFEFLADREGYSYIWALFLKCHAMLSIALHAITLYLVVLMAFIRLSAMKLTTSRWLDHTRALTSAILIALFVFVMCVPTLLAHQIDETTRGVTMTGGIYYKYSVGFSTLMMRNGCFLMKANLWLTGIFLKAIPCMLLVTFTIALIFRLRENNEKRKILIKEERAKKRGDFTTYMLLLMVTVFLFTELPQGIMAILNALFTTQFHQMVYLNLADVLDLLSLINCYVAFLVYSFTSSRYRQTLFSLLPLTRISYSGISTRQGTLKSVPHSHPNAQSGAKTIIQRANSAEVTSARSPLVATSRPNSAQPVDF
uniref:G_PROTEIN_RECEP_F1_2 domain-containing protein n=1 Tax=Caenorhabditis japonica TaxID=281687 RepID=A0A8R1DW42_CAEJA